MSDEFAEYASVAGNDGGTAHLRFGGGEAEGFLPAGRDYLDPGLGKAGVHFVRGNVSCEFDVGASESAKSF